MKDVSKNKKMIILPKIVGVFILMLAFLSPEAAFTDWKIYYTGTIGKQSGYHGRGSFATRSQCEQVRMANPGTSMSYCSGFDTPGSNVGSAVREQEKQRQLELQIEKEKKERDLAAQKERERVQKLLKRVESDPFPTREVSSDQSKARGVSSDQPTIRRVIDKSSETCTIEERDRQREQCNVDRRCGDNLICKSDCINYANDWYLNGCKLIKK